MAEAGLIRVLRRILVNSVVRNWSGKAYQYVVITTFSIRAVVTYFSALASIGIASKF